jgi:hypothetical protein
LVRARVTVSTGDGGWHKYGTALGVRGVIVQLLHGFSREEVRTENPRVDGSNQPWRHFVRLNRRRAFTTRRGRTRQVVNVFGSIPETRFALPSPMALVESAKAVVPETAKSR